MTLTRIERLVRRVRGALQGSEPGGAQIAAEFAEACREANRRIEECAGSLRRGDLGGALDLSEADPPLAEQIRVFSGVNLEAWTQKCRDQAWAVPEVPDLRAFQTLQKSLREGKSKETDPALVESFRAAMVAGDRPAALRVLATVLRRRPGDPWATGEKGKLLAKESELSLRRLEALLASGDSGALATEVDLFDQLGLEAKYRPEIYEAARERRNEVRREDVQAKVRQLLQQADARRAEGDWRDAEQILEVAAAELEEVGARPPGGHLWNELHQWVRQNRGESEQREQLRKQEEQVERELDVLEGLRREGSRRSASRLRENLETLEGFLRLPGPSGVSWPESTHRRLREEVERLVMDLRRSRKKKWLTAGGVVLFFFGAGVAVWHWKQEEIRQEFFLREIDRMISKKEVDEAEVWLKSEEAQRARGRARGAVELAKLSSFLERERGVLKAVEEDLARLEQASADTGESLALHWQAWEEFGKRLASVHPKWRSGLEDRRERALADLRGRSRKEVEVRALALREKIKQVAGEFSRWQQSSQNRPEDLAKLRPILEKLADGDVWRKESQPELAMPDDLQKEFSSMETRLREEQGLLEDFLKARQEVATATSPGDYRRALERLSVNPLLASGDREKASQVLSAWLGDFEILSALWLPWWKPAPAGLAGGAARLFPSRLEASEEAIRQDILDDEFLQNIWEYNVPRAENNPKTYRLYAQGQLKQERGEADSYTYGKGKVFIPEECAKHQKVDFEYRPRKDSVPTFMGIAGPSQGLLIGYKTRAVPKLEVNAEALLGVLNNLEKALSAEAVAPLARAPIHETLELLLPDSPGTSPLARAYLAGKVWKLAMAGKDPLRFGLFFSPSLQKATAPWSSWAAVEGGVWLKKEEDLRDLDPHWVETFSRREIPRFVDEAKLSAQLWARAVKGGFSFGGSAGEAGKRNLGRLENLEPGQVLIGQGIKGDPVVGWRYDGKDWEPKVPVRPYSPLYLMPRSPENTLLDAVREARVEDKWANDWVRRELPILFGGGG